MRVDEKNQQAGMRNHVYCAAFLPSQRSSRRGAMLDAATQKRSVVGEKLLDQFMSAVDTFRY